MHKRGPNSNFALIVIVTLLFLLLIPSSYAILPKDTYYLGDKIKLDTTDLLDQKIKIITPSSTISVKIDQPQLIYKPRETGDYSIHHKDNIYQFKVLPTQEIKIQQNDHFVDINAIKPIRDPPPQNQTNQSDILIDLAKIDHKPIDSKDSNDSSQPQIILGQPVKWKETHNIPNSKKFKLKIPQNSQNLTIYRSDLESQTNLTPTLKNESLLTKFALDIINPDRLKETSLTLENVQGEITLEFTTPAPKGEETNISNKEKELTITSPDGYHYENVLSYTTIPEITQNKEDISLFWKEESKKIYFKALDLDNDSLLDYIEWITPHLSTQTFQIYIEIKDAIHLDENRNPIENIFNLVKEQDGTWTNEIPANQFIRATFKSPLTSDRDITIYAKSPHPNATVEVYEKDSTELLATFPTISKEDFYKIYLTKLSAPQDTFDLKIINNPILFDYITDPVVFTAAHVAQIYQTGFNDDVDSETSIRFDSTTAMNPDFSHPTNTTLRIENNGLYKLSYGCTFRELGNSNRRIISSWFENDTTEIVPSRTYCYVRQTGDDGDRCSTQGVVIANLTSGSNLTLQSSTEGGGAGTDQTSEESCWMYAELVQRPVAQIYETTDGDATLDLTVHITQDFGATTYEDTSNFTVDLANNWITVDQDGWYKIYFTGTSRKTTGNSDSERMNPSSYLYLDNSAELEPSMVYSWHKRADQAYTSSEAGFTMANLNAGQNISLRRFLAAGDTVNEPETRRESWILMEKMDDNNILFLWDTSGGQPSSSNDLFLTNITWDVEEADGSNFSHAAGSEFFTINTDGLFEISYSVGWDDSGNGGRHITCARVIRDNIPLEPSKLCGYSRGDLEARYGTISANFIVNNTAGSEYAVQYSGRDNAENLEPDSSWVTVIPVKFEGTPPQVTVNNPINRTYNFSSINFEVTLDETGGGCAFSLDGGISNQSMSTTDFLNYNGTNSTMSQGSHTVSFYCNDTNRNLNNTQSVTFTIDTTTPTSSIISPLNDTFNNPEQLINVTTSDTSEVSVAIDIDNDLLLYLRMDDLNSSGGVVDSSNYSINGSVNGNANQTYLGRFGSGLHFDGESTDYISLGTTTLGYQYTTLAFWFNHTDDGDCDGGFDVFFGKESSADIALAIDCTGGDAGDLVYSITNKSGTGTGVVRSSNPITPGDGQWHHLALVVNTTTAALYIDGTFDSGTMTSFTGGIDDDNVETRIGTNSNGANHFNGTIDELLLINRSLSSQEILAIYNSSTSTRPASLTNFSDGPHQIKVLVTDSAGNLNKTNFRTFTIDTIAPTVIIDHPLPQNYTINQLQLNFSVNDTNLDSCWYSLNQGFSNTSLSDCDNTSITVPQQNVTLWVYANDTAGNINDTTNVSFFVDSNLPQLSYGPLTRPNGTAWEFDYIYVDVVINETNFANITYVLYNESGFLNSTTYFTNISNITWYGLDNNFTNYTYNVTVYDIVNNFNETGTYHLVLTPGDIQAPIVTILSPTPDGGALPITAVDFNITLDEDGDKCLYSLDDGETNTTMTEIDARNFTYTNDSIAEGRYIVTFYCNDSDGNLGATPRTFNIDLTDPTINFVDTNTNLTENSESDWAYSGTPTNPSRAVDEDFSTYSTITSDPDVDIIYMNYSVPDAVSKATLEYLADWSLLTGSVQCVNETSGWETITTFLDNVRTNVSIQSTCLTDEKLQLRVFRSLEIDFGTVDFYEEQVHWEIDSHALPSGTNISQTNVPSNVIVIDANMQNVTYQIFNSSNTLINRSTFTGQSASRFIDWLSFQEGTYSYNVTATDKANRKDVTETREITLDITNPNGTLYLPINATYSNASAVNLSVNATDNYFLNNATLVIVNESNTIIDSVTVVVSGPAMLVGITYDFLNSGIFKWFFRIRDMANNLFITTNRTITIDINFSNIFFVGPTQPDGEVLEQNFITANVSVTEENFANITFELYNSTTHINTTTYFTLTNLLNWTSLSSSNITYFYNVTVTDLASNRNSTETRNITLIDNNPPGLNLINPKNATYDINESIPLDYNATDPNLFACWYHLDDGPNITLSNCANTNFDVAEGSHILRLYANDTLGLMNTTSVTFLSNTSLTETNNWIVQRGTTSVNDLVNVGITRVNRAKSFILAKPRSADDGPDTLQVTGTLTNTTNLQFENYQSGGTATVEWEVISGPGLRVQRDEVPYTSGERNHTIVISPVNLTQAFIVISNRLNSGTSEDGVEGYFSGKFINESAILLERGANGTSGNVSWQVVEWEGAIVQNGTFSSTALSASDTIPNPVNLSQSFLIFSHRVENAIALQNNWIGGALRNNSILFYRVAAAGTMITDWYVIQTPIILAQRGNFNFNNVNTPYDQSLVPLVNRSRSFNAYSTSSTGSGTSAGNAIASTQLTNTTNLRADAGDPSAGNTKNLTWQVMEILDIEDPIVNLYNPSNEENLSSLNIYQFNYSVGDTSSLDSCTLYGNWSNGWHANQTITDITNNATLIQNFSAVQISSDGYYIWNVFCTDSYTNEAFNNTNFTFLIDSLYPQIEYDPTTLPDQTNSSQNSIFINVTVNETNEINITFTLGNSTGIHNSSTFSDQRRTINFVNLQDGTYTFNVSVLDVAGNINTTQTYTIRIDSVLPNGSLISPSDNLATSNQEHNFTVNASDNTRLSNVTLLIYNQSLVLINQTTRFVDSNLSLQGINVTIEQDGTYNWSYLITDFANNQFSTENRTISIDSTFPQISYEDPTPESGLNLSQSYIYINVSITEINLANITYILHNSTGEVNKSTYFSLTTQINWTSLPDETYTFNVTVKDSVNNINVTETRTLILDTTNPNATLLTPINNTYTNITEQNLTVNVSDTTQLDNATLVIYNSTFSEINRTTVDVSGIQALVGITYSFIYDGLFRWFYEIRDIANNIFITQNNTLTIDTGYPLIIFNPQTQDSEVNISQSFIYVNVTANDTNEANITFKLFDSNGEINTTTYFDQTRSILWESLGDGRYTYNVTITDLASLQNFTETRVIRLDTTGPDISIVEPENKAYGFNTSLNLNVSIIDTLVMAQSCWWNLDGGDNETITCGSNTTFNSTDGIHTITFFSNDTLGNVNSANVTFSISTTGPAITLTNPTDLGFIDYHGIVQFNFTALDPDGVEMCTLWGNWSGGWHANQSTRDDWLSIDWPYRKQVNITGVNNDKTNFQIQLDLYNSTGSDSGNDIYLGPNTQPDFDDLRITNESGTHFDFWIESVQSDHAVVWIEVPYLPATPDNTSIYIYYGYQDAASVSSGSDTFLLWDDFEHGQSNFTLPQGWSTYNTGNIEIIQLSGNRFALKDDSNDPNGGYANFSETGVQNFSATWISQRSATAITAPAGGAQNRYSIGVLSGGFTQSFGPRISAYGSAATFAIEKRDELNNIADITPTASITAPTDVWHEWVYWKEGPTMNYTLYNVTKTSSGWYQRTDFVQSVQVSNTSYTNMSNFFIHGGHEFFTDDIKVRKYSSTNPIFSTGVIEYYIGTFNVSFNQDASHFWNVVCNDSLGFETTSPSNFTFTIDTIFPQMNYTIGTYSSGLNLSQDFLIINVSVNETNEANITFRLFNSSNYPTNITTYTDSTYLINISNLPDSIYTYNVSITDGANHINTTQTLTLTLDTTNPNGTLISPENGTSTNQTEQNLTVNATDNIELDNLTLVIYNQSFAQINQTTVDVSGVQALVGIVYTFTVDGIYNWFYRIRDIANNLFVTQNNTLLIDTQPPVVTFVDPTAPPFNNKSQNWIFVNITVSEPNEANVTFRLFNSTAVYNITDQPAFTRTFNWTILPDDTYVYDVLVTDTSNRKNTTGTRTITIDTTPPDLTIGHPQNVNYSRNISLPLNLTATDALRLVEQCWFNLDGGTNFSIPNCLNTTFNTSQGYHTLYLFSNDTVDNLNNSENITFFVDSIFPLISFSDGVLPNQINISQSNIFVNVSVTEINEANITFLLKNSTNDVVNESFYPNPTRWVNWTSLPDDTYTFNVTVRDTAGNTNTTQTFTIRLDTTAPNGTLYLPLNGTFSNISLQNLSVNISDNFDLVNATIVIYNETLSEINRTTVDVSGVQALVGIVYDFLYDGVFSWFYNIRDFANNLFTTTNNTFTFDLTQPNILFVNPTLDDGEEAEQNFIVANVTITDENYANLTFYLYNSTGLINYTTITNENLTVNWTNLNSGNVTYFYNASARDKANNLNVSETRSLTLIDTTPPNIILTDPINSTYLYNDSLPLQYTILDLNNGSCWYNLDNSANITLSNCQNTTFNVADGAHTLYFFANDSLGLLSNLSVTFVANASLIITNTWVVHRGSAAVDGQTNVGIPRIDRTKSIHLHTNHGTADSGPNTLQVSTTLSSPTNLRLENYATGTGTQVEWEVLTGPNLSVQRNTYAYGTTEDMINISIRGVNLSQAFIIVNNRLNSDTSTENAQGFFTGKFHNATTLQLQRGINGTAGVVSWQVVEWQGATVLSGSLSSSGLFGSNTTASEVNLSRGFLIFSNRLTGDINLQELYIGGFIDPNLTSVNFHRVAASGTFSVEWFYVESRLIRSLFGNFALNNANSPNITSLDPRTNASRTFIRSSSDSTGTGDGHDNAYYGLNLTNITSLYAIVSDTSAGNVKNITWQVMEIIDDSPPLINLNQPVDWANLSSLYVEQFNFTVNDTSSVNCTFFGNWTGSWHANQSYINPITNGTISNFTNITVDDEGYYIWNVECTDFYNNIASQSTNNTFLSDTTIPNITAIYINETFACSYIQVNCTVNDTLAGVESVYIEARTPSNGYIREPANLTLENIYQGQVEINETGPYNFTCVANDSAQNTHNETGNQTLLSNPVDITLEPEDIYLHSDLAIENSPVMINATIHNNQCGNVSDFLVAFYEDDPSSGGPQISTNQSISSLAGFSNATVNVSWISQVGYANIFVYSELLDSFNETNETNNIENRTYGVTAWQEFYGNITIDKILSTSNFSNVTIWSNESAQGNIFAVDREANVEWTQLQAISRNTSGALTDNDFNEIDTLINLSTLNDSISNRYTTDGNTPRTTTSFFVHKINITNVAVINSTDNDNFITGILWDTSDSTDDSYNETEAEDIVFISQINNQAIGRYGTYDYEISIPSRLRNYDDTDDTEVYFYFDIN